MGLDVLELLSTHRTQRVHGQEITVDHNLLYVVPQEKADPSVSVTPEQARACDRR